MPGKGPTLVGLSDAAKLIGVSRARMAVLANRPDFPAPYVQSPHGRLWLAEDVDRWNRERQRRPGRKPP